MYFMNIYIPFLTKGSNPDIEEVMNINMWSKIVLSYECFFLIKVIFDIIN